MNCLIYLYIKSVLVIFEVLCSDSFYFTYRKLGKSVDNKTRYFYCVQWTVLGFFC